MEAGSRSRSGLGSSLVLCAAGQKQVPKKKSFELDQTAISLSYHKAPKPGLHALPILSTSLINLRLVIIPPLPWALFAAAIGV